MGKRGSAHPHRSCILLPFRVAFNQQGGYRCTTRVSWCWMLDLDYGKDYSNKPRVLEVHPTSAAKEAHRIISHHIILYHIISYHILSYHTELYGRDFFRPQGFRTGPLAAPRLSLVILVIPLVSGATVTLRSLWKLGICIFLSSLNCSYHWVTFYCH